MLQLHSDCRLNNTLQVECTSRQHYTLACVDRVALSDPELLACLQDPELLICGGGSNLVLATPSVARSLSVSAQHWQVLRETREYIWIYAEAGLGLNALVDAVNQRGWFGLERLAEIPGTVGAAPIQNVGAYGREMADLVNWVEAIDRHTGKICRFGHAACGFAYRDSVFKRQPQRWLITRVGLRLRRKLFNNNILAYPGVGQAAVDLGLDPADALGLNDPVLISRLIRRVRRAKLPDWQDERAPGSVGSFFHNPIVSRQFFEQLRKTHGALPGFVSHDHNKIKIPAGWLIEQRGWRGYRSGSVGVYDQHALVLVNHGAVSGQDVLELANTIAQDIKQHYGIDLIIEPRVIDG